jgi:hypothetical protein
MKTVIFSVLSSVGYTELNSFPAREIIYYAEELLSLQKRSNILYKALFLFSEHPPFLIISTGKQSEVTKYFEKPTQMTGVEVIALECV